MTQRRQTRSILKRLTTMNMLVSGLALLLACAALFVYDQVTSRRNLAHTLSAQAQIIGSNSISAILFNDPQAASETLSALKSSPSIASAGILKLDHGMFAQYSRESADEILELPSLGPDQLESHVFTSSHVVLIRKILSENDPIGFVYLKADLREIDQRLKRYATIAFSVLLLSLLAAMLVSSNFRKSVASPIVELAETAQQVSKEKNYRIRAAQTGEQDELSVLVESFNEMLEQIQERDSALQHARDELEQRVSDRTHDLTVANQQLSERTHELMSANRELEAFSYSVSHDLRGPLEALNGFTYVLLKKYGPNFDNQTRELIEHIRNSGRRMSELIDDLLNLSRVTTSVLRREQIDLSSLSRSIMDDLCRREPGRQVEFVAPTTADALADVSLMRIVLENLLGNAWKYTSQLGHARIEFGKAQMNDQTAFFVKDDGTGFDPRAANRLFQPFQRLHSVAEFPGSGIGLASVKRIIQRHGGQVWAEGSPDEGATFFFTLGPAKSEAA
jgi:signal transduction histidine kinase